MPEVNLRDFLEAGVHFGHPVRRWNPKMASFIFRERNGIHIIDLRQTAERLLKAFEAVTDTVRHGEMVLFVGTKKAAQEAVALEAARCSMPYVTNRWMGGMLTNFRTIGSRIQRMKELEEMEQQGLLNQLPTREAQMLRDDLRRMQKNLGGMRDMTRLPELLFIVDTKVERLAIAEAHRLEIPIIALVDTNCDPDEVDYPIPSNDDGMRAIRLMCRYIADAVIESRLELESQRDTETAVAQ